jgi:hypothetical protein
MIDLLNEEVLLVCILTRDIGIQIDTIVITDPQGNAITIVMQ